MTVSFEHTNYSVSEEDSIDVCVVLLGRTEINVMAILSTGEISNLPDDMTATRK